MIKIVTSNFGNVHYAYFLLPTSRRSYYHENVGIQKLHTYVHEILASFSHQFCFNIEKRYTDGEMRIWLFSK